MFLRIFLHNLSKVVVLSFTLGSANKLKAQTMILLYVYK